MIRTTITPKKRSISFDIPQSYIGKEIEVIAFAKDEGISNGASVKKNVSFTALSIDTRYYRFDRDEANER